MSPEVLLILGGQKYMEAIYVITPVSMGCICQFLYTMFVNIEQLKKKTVGMAIASAIAAAVNLGLNYFFIPRFGYLVAAYTTLVGYLVLLTIHMYLVYRLKLNIAYSYKFVVAAVLVSLIAMVLITFSFSNNIVRYVAIGIYILAFVFLVYKYKDRILAMLHRNKKT